MSEQASSRGPGVKRISVSLPPAVFDELDRLVVARGFENRSQAISEMIHQSLTDHYQDHGDRVMAGTITLFYDESKPGLLQALAEIDEIAARLGRPGGHFLSVNYEWGCTVGVGPSPDGRSARLTRTLDWFTPGLGRYVMAARVAGQAGHFVTLTWPGFVGVLQAMAPGRFSAITC